MNLVMCFLCSNHASGWTLVHTTSQKKGQHGHTIQDSWSALSMQRSPIFKSAISMDSGVSLILRQTHVLLNGTLSIVGQTYIYMILYAPMNWCRISAINRIAGRVKNCPNICWWVECEHNSSKEPIFIFYQLPYCSHFMPFKAFLSFFTSLFPHEIHNLTIFWPKELVDLVSERPTPSAPSMPPHPGRHARSARFKSREREMRALCLGFLCALWGIFTGWWNFKYVLFIT